MPRANEARRHHERIPGLERASISVLILDMNLPTEDVTELALCIPDAPLARRAFPDAREETAAAVAEVVPRDLFRIAGQQAFETLATAMAESQGTLDQLQLDIANTVREEKTKAKKKTAAKKGARRVATT